MQTAPEGHHELDDLSNKIIKLIRLEGVFKNWISEEMSYAMGNGMGKEGQPIEVNFRIATRQLRGEHRILHHLLGRSNSGKKLRICLARDVGVLHHMK